jgi:hypothetical protein
VSNTGTAQFTSKDRPKEVQHVNSNGGQVVLWLAHNAS